MIFPNNNPIMLPVALCCLSHQFTSLSLARWRRLQLDGSLPPIPGAWFTHTQLWARDPVLPLLLFLAPLQPDETSEETPEACQTWRWIWSGDQTNSACECPSVLLWKILLLNRTMHIFNPHYRGPLPRESYWVNML